MREELPCRDETDRKNQRSRRPPFAIVTASSMTDDVLCEALPLRNVLYNEFL